MGLSPSPRPLSKPALLIWTMAICALAVQGARADTLDEIRARGTMIWGADAEGGGPYVYPDPADPRRRIGFEAELADMLAGELGVRAEFFQGPWQNLPAILSTRQIDVVLNGYELTPSRAGEMEHTRPYYVYSLVLLGRRDNPRLTSWRDLDSTPADGKRLKIGVLQASAAHHYLNDHYAGKVDVVVYEGTTDAMREVETGKLDATLADLPAAVFYRQRFAALSTVGEPVGHGYYVMLLRRGDVALRAALDRRSTSSWPTDDCRSSTKNTDCGTSRSTSSRRWAARATKSWASGPRSCAAGP